MPGPLDCRLVETLGYRNVRFPLHLSYIAPTHCEDLILELNGHNLLFLAHLGIDVTWVTSDSHLVKHAHHVATVEFIKDIRAFGDMSLAGVADRKLAEQYQTSHIRKGVLSPVWCHNRDWFGTKVLAVAADPCVEVNFVLLADGRRLCI